MLFTRLPVLVPLGCPFAATVVMKNVKSSAVRCDPDFMSTWPTLCPDVFEGAAVLARITDPSMKKEQQGGGGGDSRMQGSATALWVGQSQVTNRESYETGPHFVSHFDNLSGPVDSFGTDRLFRLAVF